MRIAIHPLFCLVAIIALILSAFDFFLALCVAVICHEMAHNLTARYHGIHAERLVLTPFGGALQLDVAFLDNRQKISIYLAGPIFSFILCLICGLLIWLFPVWFIWLEYLVAANFLVGILNILPFYNFDGGKILACYLAAKYILFGSDLVFVVLLVGALFSGQWWLVAFAIVMLMQFNCDYHVITYHDKFCRTPRVKIGKFIVCAVSKQTTLLKAYQMVHNKRPTQFVVTDADNKTFYENDLEHWLIEHQPTTLIGNLIH